MKASQADLSQAEPENALEPLWKLLHERGIWPARTADAEA